MSAVIRSRSMMAREVGDVLVFVHTNEAPSDTEWEKALELLRDRASSSGLRTLVFTAGGAPNAAQRARLNAIIGVTKPPIAVLTSSPIARAAGTAISWFNPMFKVFGADDIDGALDHLALRGIERTRSREALLEMKRDLLASPRAAAR